MFLFHSPYLFYVDWRKLKTDLGRNYQVDSTILNITIIPFLSGECNRECEEKTYVGGLAMTDLF